MTLLFLVSLGWMNRPLHCQVLLCLRVNLGIELEKSLKLQACGPEQLVYFLRPETAPTHPRCILHNRPVWWFKNGNQIMPLLWPDPLFTFSVTQNRIPNAAVACRALHELCPPNPAVPLWAHPLSSVFVHPVFSPSSAALACLHLWSLPSMLRGPGTASSQPWNTFHRVTRLSLGPFGSVLKYCLIKAAFPHQPIYSRYPTHMHGTWHSLSLSATLFLFISLVSARRVLYFLLHISLQS